MSNDSQRRIVLLLGHPDPNPARLGYALAEAYAQGAREAGHALRRIELGKLDFPILRSKEDWISGELPPSLQSAQEAIRWAEHVALFFPLWLGTMPALVKAFLEQVLRPGFAITAGEQGQWQRALQGRSARVVVTMGMPAPIYRWYFFAHGVRGLERNVLAFCGLRPVRQTLIGMVDGGGRQRHERHFEKMRALGRRAR
ncbi:MAG TPA: NAD(P)H-dependent oxidoreductase [Zeimonas sp.]|nr:NAD(P)H-dependent oxidoreductase [Zeimonas sp.]